MDIYGKSDIGLVRQTNQDDIRFKKVDDNIIWVVVCDGMGGANGGDVAGSMAVNKISEIFEDYFRGNDKTSSIREIMNYAVDQAGDLIYKTAETTPDLKGMGTTVVAAIFFKNLVHIIHLGDSRAYLVNDESISQITVDHSIVQEMIKKGEITKEQAVFHPQKNILTKALGIQKTVYPDYIECELKRGDKIVLCTDGLTNELSDKEIYELINKNSPDEVADILINEAKARKGADNITVALVV